VLLIADIKHNSMMIKDRFNQPDGFTRISPTKESFGKFLQNHKLHPDGSSVHLYDGSVKKNQVWEAVLDFPILKKDLIQCADAIIKLRAEYLYAKGDYEKIVFTLTNGMAVPYKKFIEGFRIKVSGNKTEWIKTDKMGENRKVFDEYLEFLYTYCSTSSLLKDTVAAKISEIEIGDVFLQAGSPGHAVLVVDLAENSKGEKIMILAQSYMPSQEMHILKSFSEISPWYKVEDKELKTPEWTFPKGSLRKWK
jgi:hypothetical protein